LGLHPAVRTVVLVSAGSHLRRLRACCEALFPKGTRFLLTAVPEDSPSGTGSGKRLAVEYAKLFLYMMVLAFKARRTRRTPAPDRAPR
jgi:hypothetical protein